MDLAPYLETLRRELTASAAPGGTEVLRAAELLTGSLDAAARLTLLELLSDAAAEITTRLGNASVDVRLHGRDADFVVTELAAPEEVPPPPARSSLPLIGPAGLMPGRQGQCSGLFAPARPPVVGGRRGDFGTGRALPGLRDDPEMSP